MTQARMTHPTAVLPAAMTALLDLGRAAAGTVPEVIQELVQLRVSQINDCAFCVELHAGELAKAGESDERIRAVGTWRESPHFTDAERAALDLAESATRLADRADAVPDDVWAAAADVFSEKELAGLLVVIAGINAWNRLNAAVRQPAGRFW